MLFQGDDLVLQQEDPQTAVLWFDVRNQRHNIFTAAVLAQLEQALEVLQANPPRRLLLRSRKPAGFCAGADIQAFRDIRSPAQAEALSEQGQRLFGKLSRLPATTLAVIHGPCLGGGLELALACDYRLVVDRPDTQLGFPEVELGLIPAWSGCLSLPRVVGIEKALEMILTGKRYTAKEAVRIGLADECLPAGAESAPVPEELWTRWKAGKRAWTVHPARSLRQVLLERNGWGRALLFHAAGKRLARRVPDDMPAPGLALTAVRTGLDDGLEAGLAAERRAAAELSRSEACRQLIRLFFLRERYRKVPESLADLVRPGIRKIGVVGAGAMGSGIAQLALVRGYSVALRDVSQAALDAGLQRIRSLCDKAASRGLISPCELQDRLQALQASTSWDGFADADIVVEAVVEDPSVKQQVFQELERILRPEAILATNTSSLSLSELSRPLLRPERFAAVHFFNPVHKMPLVEVGRTERTSPEVAATLVAWAVSLGKLPVLVRDSPGFVVNRVLLPYLYEAMQLLREGADPADVDEGLRRFGMPVGPFQLLDQIGLDIAHQVTCSLQPRFADRFPAEPVFDRFAQAGLLGVKSGRGFYAYRNGKARPDAAWRRVLDVPETRRLRLDSEELRERLVYPMLNEAAACLGEKIVDTPEDVDAAVVFGTGWAPHRGGPLRFADRLGLPHLVGCLNELAQRLGPRFRPCPELERRAAENRPFYPEDR